MSDLQHHLSDLHAALQTAIDSTREIALLIREDPRLGASLANQNSRLGTFGDYITGQLFTCKVTSVNTINHQAFTSFLIHLGHESLSHFYFSSHPFY